MKRLPRLKLDWSDGRASGPDGTEYAIQRAQLREEGTVFGPMVKRPGGKMADSLGGALGSGSDPYPEDWPEEGEVFRNGFRETKEQAIRWCEVDAYRRAHRDGFIVRDRETDEEVHFVASEKSGRDRERVETGLLMRVDFERFYFRDTRDDE